MYVQYRYSNIQLFFSSSSNFVNLTTNNQLNFQLPGVTLYPVWIDTFKPGTCMVQRSVNTTQCTTGNTRTRVSRGHFLFFSLIFLLCIFCIFPKIAHNTHCCCCRYYQDTVLPDNTVCVCVCVCVCTVRSIHCVGSSSTISSTIS